MSWEVQDGDCIDLMRAMPEASADAVVCDPPYGLSREPDPVEVLKHWLAGDDYQHRGGGFMGRSWDSFVPGPSYWREARRVLKPGGYLVAFGGTRTYDLLAMAVRLAGFEVRDQLQWLYGQGFPKSLDVAKAIDKTGAVDAVAFKAALREAVERSGLSRAALDLACGFTMRFDTSYEADPVGWGVSLPSPEKWQAIKAALGVTSDAWDGLIDRVWRGRAGAEVSANAAMAGSNLERSAKGAPVTPEAQRWQGWGTALKPAHEPIVLARKPLAGTVVGNVLEHGTGALNVDGCRIGQHVNTTLSGADRFNARLAEQGYRPGAYQRGAHEPQQGEPGRWPANVVLDPEAAALLDEQTGERRGSGVYDAQDNAPSRDGCVTDFPNPAMPGSMYADVGGASRFFYVAKASSAERNAGLWEFEAEFAPTMGNGIGGKEHDPDTATPKRNKHPTVKPIALMRWLTRLVTPPGGLVLDPFCGSGSTGCAAVLEGMRFIGMERGDPPGDPAFSRIARARIAWWEAHPEGMELVERLTREAERREREAAGQESLFS